MRRRGVTLIEMSVALVLIALLASVAYAWTAISMKTANVALRTALQTSEQERLTGNLQADLAQAAKLTPDDRGFTLELPREDGGVDKVGYTCVERGKKKVLVRTFTPPKGTTEERTVVTEAESCTGELIENRTYRVRVRWRGAKGTSGHEMTVDVARRVGS